MRLGKKIEMFFEKKICYISTSALRASLTHNFPQSGRKGVTMNAATLLGGFKKILAHAKMEEKPHQIAGVKWCLENELTPTYIGKRKIRGGFIADEMGLGKTITMIGTIFCNFKMPTLIVVPVVLIEQWHSEIFRATGHKALIYHGASKLSITREKLEKSPIVIATYSTIATTFSKPSVGLDLESPFSKVEWYRVIFDEAHHLRNCKTRRFLAAKMLKTKIRWLVTGTPVQNKKDDFYALCNLLRIPSSIYADSENIPFIYEKFILKRTKNDIGISLPDIVYQNAIIPWSGKMEEKFVANIHSHLSFSGTQLSEKDVPMKFKNYEVIQLLTRAKQCCILPNMAVNSISNESITIPTASKMDAVVKAILDRKTNDNGKLVFCHYKEEIDILIQRLREGGIERIASIDGRNTITSRALLLSQSYDVLVLQIQTCCEGLNLQKNYNEIYFVTPHWNPSVEDQAIARCHRIGQTKPVYVFRFEMDPPLGKVQKAASVSFDNYVFSVQTKKREIVKKYV